MKIHNWEKFNERLSEETLKSAEDKAREYGDEETANKFKKHNYMTQNKENIVTLYNPIKAKKEEYVINGVDLGSSFDMWRDDKDVEDIGGSGTIISLPFFFIDINKKYLSYATEGDERIDMWISFKENGLKFYDVNFTDSEGEDAEFKFPIQDAKKVIKNFKQTIKEGIDDLSRRPTHHPLQSEDIGIFTEYLKEISSKLNYRMLPLMKM